MMAAIDPSLAQAAGFVGANAQQRIESAQAKGAIQQNQLNLSGEQQRDQINTAAEDRGMFNSTRRLTELGWQGADQGNRSQLVDLGVNDTISGANLDVMQELARKQLADQEAAQRKQLFDAQMALQWQQLQNAQAQNTPIDWAAVQQLVDAQNVQNSPTGRPSGQLPDDQRHSEMGSGMPSGLYGRGW